VGISGRNSATLWSILGWALIRQALERHLQFLRELDLEEKDRRGYLAHPQEAEEFRIWEDVASWPRA